MFRIHLKCFVDDKNLPKFYWALNGLALETEIDAQPVANAVAKRGKVADATGGGGNIVEVLRAYLKANKMKTMNAKEAKAFQVHVGRSVTGYSALLARAQNEGLLKKTGKADKAKGYAVVGAK